MQSCGENGRNLPCEERVIIKHLRKRRSWACSTLDSLTDVGGKRLHRYIEQGVELLTHTCKNIFNPSQLKPVLLSCEEVFWKIYYIIQKHIANLKGIVQNS